jgi:prepilin-type N-terminal cleavage/methylation domain-containing protein/prepilin-type processing-associated H-X9-DG protein
MKNFKTPRSYSSFPGLRRARAAFTLIELLVVIAIIGILAGILIPAVGKVRESSHSATCVSNLRQITAVSLMYANENHGRMPTYGKDPSGNFSYWFHKIAPMLGGAKNINPSDAERKIEAYRCPSALAQHTPGSNPNNSLIKTYGLNAVLNNTDSYPGSDGEFIVPGMLPLKAINPAKTAFIMDGHLANPRSPYWHRIVTYDMLTKSVGDNFVHSGTSINVAFLDGHVSNITAEELPEAESVFWNPLALR